MGEDNHVGVWAAFGDGAVVHGMCEDYRAGLRVNRVPEEAGRAAGRKIRCPMLLLVSTDDDLGSGAAGAGRRIPSSPASVRGLPPGGTSGTRRASPRPEVEHLPADVVPSPLVPDGQFTDRIWNPRGQPHA